MADALPKRNRSRTNLDLLILGRDHGLRGINLASKPGPGNNGGDDICRKAQARTIVERLQTALGPALNQARG